MPGLDFSGLPWSGRASWEVANNIIVEEARPMSEQTNLDDVIAELTAKLEDLDSLKRLIYDESLAELDLMIASADGSVVLGRFQPAREGRIADMRLILDCYNALPALLERIADLTRERDELKQESKRLLYQTLNDKDWQSKAQRHQKQLAVALDRVVELDAENESLKQKFEQVGLAALSAEVSRLRAVVAGVREALSGIESVARWNLTADGGEHVLGRAALSALALLQNDSATGETRTGEGM